MSSEFAIEARGLGKCYRLYPDPGARLKQVLWGRWKQYYREHWALRDVEFSVRPGEVVGVVGRNGAGKSTLLQMICGTLEPSAGELRVQGRVAALLELGAGFSPDFTGLENVYMNGAILGLSRAQIEQRLDDILAFADIGEFIHQPVKTYSSGMFMRLAFSVATSVEPDILVIDEALSVGDGAFARKSFDRIMGMKEAGKTILFCSHSMYQVEALCSRALWIENGALRMLGPAAKVTNAYQATLQPASAPVSELATALAPRPEEDGAHPAPATAAEGTGRILSVTARVDGEPISAGTEVELHSGRSELSITIAFAVDPQLPPPSVAVGFSDLSGVTVASAMSRNDQFELQVDERGFGQATVVFPRFPLLKGRYSVASFVACERALHIYDQAERSLMLHVTQEGLEQGLVTLAHRWAPEPEAVR